ncbi:MAG: hypothetical protein ACI4FO_09310 [Acutalibacteraceae bacterium]
MSRAAYRDRERTELVLAEDCTINDMHKTFYCENTECNARLYPKARKSVINAHFAAYPQHRHIQGCFASGYGSFSVTSHDEFSFDFNNLISDLTSPSRSNNLIKKAPNITVRASDEKDLKPITTLSQLYKLCKSLSPNTSYNGFRIGNMLFDNRNNNFITKGIWGKHILECKYSCYNRENQYIYLKYPLNDDRPNHYTIRLNFENRDLFEKINRKVYGYDYHPIVIIGNFSKCGDNTFATNINSGKQIYLP